MFKTVSRTVHTSSILIITGYKTEVQNGCHYIGEAMNAAMLQLIVLINTTRLQRLNCRQHGVFSFVRKIINYVGKYKPKD